MSFSVVFELSMIITNYTKNYHPSPPSIQQQQPKILTPQQQHQIIMSNSNRQPSTYSPYQLQTQAHRNYLLHNYNQSLQLYTQCLKHPTLPPITKLFIQTTIAIVHIHLHNYPYAFQKLSELIPKIIGYKNTLLTQQPKNKSQPSSKQPYLQCQLLHLKSQICLVLIELANSNRQYVYQHLDIILAIIDEIQDKKERVMLFRSVLVMMFGVCSFGELGDAVQGILLNDDDDGNGYGDRNGDEDYMQNIARPPSTNTILLSSLSLTTELLNNPQLSYQLEHKSYQTHKNSSSNPSTIPLLISLKHLIHLSDILKNTTLKQTYKQQFNRLMNTPEIYGISQQTLFRCYQEKIQCGRGVVQVLVQYQRKLMEDLGRIGNGKTGKNNQSDMNRYSEDALQQDIYLNWLRKKVVYKLQQTLSSLQNHPNTTNTQNTQKPPIPKQTLIRTLTSLSNPKTGPQILSFMLNSQLIQNILKQQQTKINKLCRCMGQVGLVLAWRVMMMLPPKVQAEEVGVGNVDRYHSVGGNLSNNNLYRFNNKSNVGNVGNYTQQYNKQQKPKKQYLNYQTTNPSKITNNNPNKSLNTNQPLYRNQYQQKIMQESRRQEQLTRQKQKQIQRQRRQRQRQLQQQKQKQRQLLLQNTQKQKQIQRLKNLTKKQQQQNPIQKQIRLKHEQKQQKQQRLRYQQFRSKQQNNNHPRYHIARNQIIEKDRDISRDQRDLSRDDKKYIGNNNIGERKIRRKIQHASVIPKSPRYNSQQYSPYAHYNPSQSSPPPSTKQPITTTTNNNHIKIHKTNQPNQHQHQQLPQQTQKNSNHNPSLIKNSELNTSKIVNSMNNVYLDSQASRFVNPLEQLYQGSGQQQQKVDGNVGRIGKGLNSKVEKRNNNNSSFNNNNNSKVEQQEILNNAEQPVTTPTNNNIPTNPTNTNTNNNNIDIISLLKSQNTRIKTTQSQLSQQRNPSKITNPTKPPQTQSLPQQKQPQFNTIPNSTIRSRLNQSSNKQEEIVQFNNVDIVIQPAINTNNFSNLGRSQISQFSYSTAGNNNNGNNSNNGNNFNQPSGTFSQQPPPQSSHISQQQLIPQQSNIFNQPSSISQQSNHPHQQQQQHQQQSNIFNQPQPSNISNITQRDHMLSFADDNSQFILPSSSSRLNNNHNNNQQQPTQTQTIIQPQSQPQSNQTSNIQTNPNPNPNSNTNINPNQNPIFSKTSSHDLKPHSKLQPFTSKSPYIRKLTKLCTQGQYFVKRHFSSDGGEEKFVQLSGEIIKWAVDQDKIATKYQSYKLRDIKGIAYGKVSDTFLKQCNKKLVPWLCFSLILQKRTLDFYCTDQIDPLIWLPGLSAALAGQTLALKYPKKKQKNKTRQAKVQDVPVSLYTPGRVLWKRVLMKLQQNYIKPLKKHNRRYYNANAYAIILWNKQQKKSKLKTEQ